MQYLGLDIGTTTITAVVLNVKTGAVVTVQTAPNTYEITSASDKKQGRSEWDADRIIAQAQTVIKQAVNTAGPIAGVGVTGQMHGVVLVSDQGNAIGPFIGWQDRRGLENKPNTDTTYVEHMRQIAIDLGAFDQGCRPHPGYLGTTLFWLAQTNRLPQGVTASFMPDYAVAQLTGTRPITDATNAAGSGLFNSIHRVWHLDLLHQLGLQKEHLPDIHPSGETAGSITRAIADLTGLSEGTPVCVACGDNQASFAGSVGNYTNSVLINVGTGGQVSAYVPTSKPTVELEARPFMDGGFLLVGAGLVGGRSYAWLRDFFKGIGQAFFGATGNEDLYDIMNTLAADVPKGSDGLFCEPLFTGTRREPHRRGLWQGVGTTNFTPGHMARALLEGLAEQFARLYDEMGTIGAGGRTQLVGAGNGIRKNALLRHILEDRFDMTMAVPKHTEEAAFGAALMGAIGHGTFAHLKEAGQVIHYA